MELRFYIRNSAILPALRRPIQFVCHYNILRSNPVLHNTTQKTEARQKLIPRTREKNSTRRPLSQHHLHHQRKISQFV